MRLAEPTELLGYGQVALCLLFTNTHQLVDVFGD
jgi:hypothetical protein